MTLLALLACGPSLPEWASDTRAGPVEDADGAEIRFGSPAGKVAETLTGEGWTAWNVVDEAPIDSHFLRLERDGVWADLRETGSGSRLLVLDEAPVAQPADPTPIELVLPDPERALTLAQSCQSDTADVRFSPGRYLTASGRTRDSGAWRLEGHALVLEGPLARRCEPLRLVGRVTPKLLMCGSEPLLWCGAPKGPVIAVVDAGGGEEAVARAGALATRPIDAKPLVYTAAGGSEDGLVVVHAEADAARVRGEKLAYRLRRDLGVPVAVRAGNPGLAPVELRVGAGAP